VKEPSIVLAPVALNDPEYPEPSVELKESVTVKVRLPGHTIKPVHELPLRSMLSGIQIPSRNSEIRVSVTLLGISSAVNRF
jgi:hypothetical protein